MPSPLKRTLTFMEKEQDPSDASHSTSSAEEECAPLATPETPSGRSFSVPKETTNHASATATTSTEEPAGSSSAAGPPVKKAKTFGQQSKNFLLTFPHCQMPPNDIFQRAKGKWPNELVWCSVAKELHEDGSPHMHAVLCFKRSMKFQTPTWADFLCDKHGDYKTIKNSPQDLARALKYVAKGGVFSIFGDITESLYKQILKQGEETNKGAKKTQIWLRFVEQIESGKTVEELSMTDDYKGLVAQNCRKIREYMDFLSCKEQKISEADRFSHLECTIEPSTRSWALRYLLYWFNSGEHVGNRSRGIRSKQLWIVADFGAGKTTLLRRLSDHLRLYIIPPHEDWYCSWDDKKYDLAILDEFHGQKQVNWLNSWLDGSLFPVKRKGGMTYVKRHNVPTLIFSNFSPAVCYKKAEEDRPGSVGPLIDRVEYLTLTTEEVRSLAPHTRTCSECEECKQPTVADLLRENRERYARDHPNSNDIQTDSSEGELL